MTGKLVNCLNYDRSCPPLINPTLSLVSKTKQSSRQETIMSVVFYFSTTKICILLTQPRKYRPVISAISHLALIIRHFNRYGDFTRLSPIRPTPGLAFQKLIRCSRVPSFITSLSTASVARTKISTTIISLNSFTAQSNITSPTHSTTALLLGVDFKRAAQTLTSLTSHNTQAISVTTAADSQWNAADVA